MNDQTQSMLIRAKQAFGQGEREQARKVLDQIILLEPKNAQAWLLLAYVVKYSNEREDCAKQLLKIDPSNVEAKRILAATKASHKKPVKDIDSRELAEIKGLELEEQSNRREGWVFGGFVVGVFAIMVTFGSLNSPSSDLSHDILTSLAVGGAVMVGIWAVGMIVELRKDR